ncbi:MAG TPA: hypothetical protein PK289_06350 [Bacteroidia bacterium]|jgi:tetratricopeptide (TPR) repeat protein|nr:hypothetical protein [Bacteroidia bacterium]HRG52943.1 hypothetical protein [Bacteroidia bacterium]
MRIITTGIFIFLFVNCFSQQSSTKDIHKIKNEVDMDSVVYATARANADYQVMMTSLYYLMAKNPKRIIAYKDSLTRIYYLTGAYGKCIKTGNEVLSQQQENYEIIELVAISERILGNIKNALTLYEKLYHQTSSLIHAYYIAEMQFYMQRYGECMTTLDKIIASENSKKEKMELIVTDSTKQIVSLTAAAFNIKGMTYNALGKYEEAKEAFKNALLIDKDFILPKANLDKVK